MMDGVYIGIGSNLGDPIAQVKSAITALNDLDGVHLADFNILKEDGLI